MAVPATSGAAAIPDAAMQRERPALAPELIEKLQPLNLSGQRVLPVPEVLEPLFPWGGIQKGTSLAVGGSGAWSLAMALLPEALGAEGWLAVVGAPDVGLVAAADFGLRLDRVLVVETPPLHQWSSVVASLLEAVDVVAICPDGRVGPRDARRLAARAREQGSVLLHLDQARTWPTAVDVTLDVQSPRWRGLGQGHGCLRARRVTVVSTGRRSAAKQSSVELWLPGPDGRLAAAGAEAGATAEQVAAEQVAAGLSITGLSTAGLPTAELPVPGLSVSA